MQGPEDFLQSCALVAWCPEDSCLVLSYKASHELFERVGTWWLSECMWDQAAAAYRGRGVEQVVMLCCAGKFPLALGRELRTCMVLALRSLSALTLPAAQVAHDDRALAELAPPFYLRHLHDSGARVISPFQASFERLHSGVAAAVRQLLGMWVQAGLGS